MDVVILAGGRGRRFGGVKQFVSVAPNGATLLEVTVSDARQAGCDRAVIVTGPGCEEDVRALFAARPVTGCAIVVVAQQPDDLPCVVPVLRDRPWGTAHALWSARNVVSNSFLLFNADDFYGPNAAAALASALGRGTGAHFAMLGYRLGATLSPAGKISRAICETDTKGRLKALLEYPAIDSTGCVVAGGEAGQTLPLTALVSMNAWGFTPAIFPLIEIQLQRFLAEADLENEECYLPAVVDVGVRSGDIEVSVVPASDSWCGMTWPEDRQRVARRLADLAAVKEAAAGFGLVELPTAPIPYGAGLVNATWRIESVQGPRLLQRLNSDIFRDPCAVVKNAAAAAHRIDDALLSLGDDDPRHRLVYLAGTEGNPWLTDSAGGVWRCLVFVSASRSPDIAVPTEIRAAAQALGRFPGLVANGAGPEIQETICGFHDTPARFDALCTTANADAAGRLASCRGEYDRLIELAWLANLLMPNCLPTRPVHNDAKLDNVLLDAETGNALCVVDLDTVMPGLAPHDFGDLVRSAVTGCPEDEPDLEQVVFREAVFCNLAEGYLAGAEGWLTAPERERFVDGTLVIVYEQTVRFLTDYLAGDVYYKTDDGSHNLRRARAQLCLLEQLVTVADDLRGIVAAI